MSADMTLSAIAVFWATLAVVVVLYLALNGIRVWMRGLMELTPDERELLAEFNALPPRVRAQAIARLKAEVEETLHERR